MQPTDRDSGDSTSPNASLTPANRIQRSYQVQWQPQSWVGVVIALLIMLLLLAAVFMFSLMLIIGSLLLTTLIAGIVFWKRHTDARRR